MNKKQVQKHKDIIKWWINNTDKGVWRKDSLTNDWYIDLEPSFYEDYIYIQNDEYAEFRKALVDGKEIETLNTYALWDKMLDSNFHGCPDKYRIKPEEPKFQIGDWINGIRDDGTIFTTRQFNHYDEGIKPPNGHTYELWKPEFKEICVFWNDESEYIVSAYKGKIDIPTKYIPISEGIYGTEKLFNNIAPLEFIQTLKDK